ncbi:MAG: gliding motility protein GldL [Bacteroidaceae bacterium]|nr:gliding motility protein GldL [Bacteroidaceae bacterium]
MNIVEALQRWMDSKSGQTFLNYAYSWGASIVILGTLFKLTHLPGANLMLFIGMGTEVVVFFLSAFDRPFEEKQETAEITAVQQGTAISGPAYVGGGASGADFDSEETVEGATATGGGTTIIGSGGGGGTTIIGGGGGGGGTIVIGGGGVAGEGGEMPETVVGGEGAPVITPFTPSEGLQAAAAQQGIGGGSLLDIIRLANEEMLQRAQASLTPEMEEASRQYVEKLQLLTETLDRVEKQSARLTTDSEEMTNLNRTLTGINTVYELQLKSISQQIGTIDSINEQTSRMAAQIEELNGVYARMIKALTVNMKNAANPAAPEQF